MPHFRERPNYVRPPSRYRRPRPAAFLLFGEDAPTALDILLALPPQSRRVIRDQDGRL